MSIAPHHHHNIIALYRGDLLLSWGGERDSRLSYLCLATMRFHMIVKVMMTVTFISSEGEYDKVTSLSDSDGDPHYHEEGRNIFLWLMVLLLVILLADCNGDLPLSSRWDISYLWLMVTRPMAYQVAMPRSGMDNQRTILNIIARDETRLDTLSDDGMPCEMDNQLQGEIPYLEESIQIQIHVF